MIEPTKCECGCGGDAPIAQWSDTSQGWVKGQPMRFIWGHSRRLTNTYIHLENGTTEIVVTQENGVTHRILIDTVDFDTVSKYQWCIVKDGQTFYARTNLPQHKTLVMHKLLLPNTLVDHKDSNGLNNTRHNLRMATQAQNTWNRRKNSNTRNRFKGVYPVNCKWRARIQLSGRSKHLGCFVTEVEAAHAYDKAAKEYFGEFARLNFPEEKAA